MLWNSMIQHSACWVQKVNFILIFCFIVCFSLVLSIVTSSWRTFCWIAMDTLYSQTSAWAKNSYLLIRYADVFLLCLAGSVYVCSVNICHLMSLYVMCTDISSIFILWNNWVHGSRACQGNICWTWLRMRISICIVLSWYIVNWEQFILMFY